MLRIHNTLTGKKEIFTPLQEGAVRMYVCGMTVYDYCHLGHARVLVVFDTVYRHLQALGYDTTYVRNITDIDDKIIQRANENGESIEALTSRFITAMHEDCEALSVLPPSLEPKATDNIDEIIQMTSLLIEKGHAYAAENGDVYYAVKTFDGYGALSGKQLEDLRAGERVAVDQHKQDPMDFVLWKAAKEGEPAWASPWGNGRPGWHIECSAMSTCCLGNHFDIHGGGLDLQFPHHENEIAQSEAATGETFVNYWMHNGFIRVDEEKMSKSLGNFFTIRDVLERYDAEEVRYFILSSHYRSPLNYSEQQLDNARQGLTRFYTALRGVSEAEVCTDPTVLAFVERFDVAMNDDFNTPEAIAILFEMVTALNRAKEAGEAVVAEYAAMLKKLAGRLGLLQADAEAYLQGGDAGEISSEDIESLISQRATARNNKDWAESDRIRDLLGAQGVVLEDAGKQTTWRREK